MRRAEDPLGMILDERLKRSTALITRRRECFCLTYSVGKESIRRNSGHMISVAFHLMMIRGQSTQTVRHTALARPMCIAACGHTPPTTSRAKHNRKPQSDWQPNRLGQ